MPLVSACGGGEDGKPLTKELSEQQTGLAVQLPPLPTPTTVTWVGSGDGIKLGAESDDDDSELIELGWPLYQ